jgi:FixJ family two-component response regulator
MPNAKALIAIVDDDVSVREAIQRLMKSAGLSAETFASAQQFLKSTSLRSTACLVADVQMPGMSGIELHHWLVADGEQIPVILITAYPQESMRLSALKAGVSCYLPKPFRDDDLLDCVHEALGRAARAP